MDEFKYVLLRIGVGLIPLLIFFLVIYLAVYHLMILISLFIGFVILAIALMLGIDLLDNP